MASSEHAALAKTWIHSHEEDKGGLQVFRPADYAFPPARGRDALHLEAGGDAHFVQKLSRPDETLTFTLARSITREREQYDYNDTFPLPTADPAVVKIPLEDEVRALAAKLAAERRAGEAGESKGIIGDEDDQGA